MAKVAILLAAYNGTKWLKSQLETILNQQEVDVHIFVSVDISSDGTEEFVDQFALREKRLTVLPHGKKFGGAARNFFRLLSDVSFEGFDYVAFSDQDDLWQLDKLTRSHKKLKQMGADAYSSNVIAFWPSGKEILIKKSQPQKEWDFLFESAGPGCTYLFTNELALEIQSFVLRYKDELGDVWFHDWLCYAFARAKRYKWVIDDYPSVKYRQHTTNQIGANFGWKPVLHRISIILSTRGFEQTYLFATLLDLSEHKFIQQYILNATRLNFIMLAFKARLCRRRKQDQFYFAFALIAMALMGR